MFFGCGNSKENEPPKETKKTETVVEVKKKEVKKPKPVPVLTPALKKKREELDGLYAQYRMIEESLSPEDLIAFRLRIIELMYGIRVPFYEHTALQVADFHADIYRFVKEYNDTLVRIEKGLDVERSLDFEGKYVCFGHAYGTMFMHNPSHTVNVKLREAIRYYRKAMKEDPGSQEIKDKIKVLNEQGSLPWSYCDGGISKRQGRDVSVEKEVTRLHNDYVRIFPKSLVPRLVELDTKIREFVRSSRKWEEGYRNLWKDTDKELGLNIGHYSDLYEYNGKFLKMAHSINPRSGLRKYTLFSDINSEDCWVGNPDNLKAAFNYLKEFPTGPFETEVYYLLGMFHWSLHNELKYNEEAIINTPIEKLGRKVHYGDLLLLVYIKDLAEVPIKQQQEQARHTAIKYLELYLEQDKEHLGWVRISLKGLKEGSNQRYGIFSCPD